MKWWTFHLELIPLSVVFLPSSFNKTLRLHIARVGQEAICTPHHEARAQQQGHRQSHCCHLPWGQRRMDYSHLLCGSSFIDGWGMQIKMPSWMKVAKMLLNALKAGSLKFLVNWTLMWASVCIAWHLKIDQLKMWTWGTLHGLAGKKSLREGSTFFPRQKTVNYCHWVMEARHWMFCSNIHEKILLWESVACMISCTWGHHVCES